MGSEPRSDDSMPRAKRIKHDNSENQHSSNDTAPSCVASALPEEILLGIFSNINPPSNQVGNGPYDSFWSSADILSVALTCHRFYRLVIPRAFESWCHRTWGAKDGKHRQDWSPCLRAVLRQPVLGTYLRTVEVGLGEVHYWKIANPANERGDFDNWLESDFELADAVVNELCMRDIWREFPGGISKMALRYPERPWSGKRGRKNVEQIKAEEAIQEWSRCIRAGRCDAILALLMAVAPNMEKLRVSGFEGLDEHQSHSWDSFRIGENANFLERIFRGATNSQLAELANVDDDKSRRMGDLLSSLRSIEIRTRDDDTRRTEVRQVLPYLTLPSLEYASLRSLEDIWGTDRDVHGVKLFLKSLDVAFHKSEGTTSICRVLRCCPNIEHLSYSSTGEFRDGESDFENESLVDQLSDMVPQLKSLTIGATDFERVDGSTAFPDFDGAQYGEDENRLILKQLTSLDIHWVHIDSDRLPDFWRLFSPTLQILTIREFPADGTELLTERVQSLGEARREGLVPNLKKVVICHTEDREAARRTLAKGQYYYGCEEGACEFFAMEDACRKSPIAVEQVYAEPVTSLDIEWDDVSDGLSTSMGDYLTLWHWLPWSLETLTIRNLPPGRLVEVLRQQMKGLRVWKERLVPHLKEVNIVHDSTQNEVKREMGAEFFESMEKACSNAPVSAKQVYRDELTPQE